MAAFFSTTLLSSCAKNNGFRDEASFLKSAKFVKKDIIWSNSNHFDFLNSLPSVGLLILKKTLEIIPSDASNNALKGGFSDVVEISVAICDKSSWFHICRSPADFDYHGMVLDIASRAGISFQDVKRVSTFDLENLIMKKYISELEREFSDRWNGMSMKERREILQKVDPEGRMGDHSVISSLHASVVINVFSALVKSSGFSAYAKATSVLAFASRSVGVVLPFTVYSSLSKVISVISGPYGKLASGTISLFGFLLDKKPDFEKMTSYVLALHALKIDSLQAFDM